MKQSPSRPVPTSTEANVYPSLSLKANADKFQKQLPAVALSDASCHSGVLGVILDYCVALCAISRPHVYPSSSWGFGASHGPGGYLLSCRRAS